MASPEFDKRLEDRVTLRNLISQWNANRLDLFALSEPNEDLEFHGVMRFYFQDSDQRVVTKCLRVASSAWVRDVVPTLIEKFRPDIGMLSAPDYSRYALYEIHENGEERKLGNEERPLIVQLRWHEHDREGRFLFRRMDAKSHLPRLNEENSLRFQKKRMSKREKKKLAKKQAESAAQLRADGGEEKIAHKLYSEMPETSFTRSISNPEAVMRRRRQQKLERKLQQFREESAALATRPGVTGVAGGGGGGPGAGGTLRIFGESLNRDVPYKTLLLSIKDSAAHVVREMLDKYALECDEAAASKYCLVQVFVAQSPNGGPNDGSLPTDSSLVKEYILDDDDCPLAIMRQHNRNKGTLSFHIRRRPHDYQPRKRKKKPKSAQLPEGVTLDRLPYLQEIRLSPDGSWLEEGAVHRLLPDMTEIGGAGGIVPPHPQSLVLPGLLPRHCVIAHTHGGIVTVTPSGDPNAETYLNEQRILDTTIFQHGAILRLGSQQPPPGSGDPGVRVGLKDHTFRFVDPSVAAYPSAMQNPQPQAGRMDPMGPRPASVSGEYDPKNERHASTNSDGSMAAPGAHHGSVMPPGRDPILPAVLEFWEDHENVFLDSVITRLDPAQVQFKLSPTYALYMAARYRASTHFRPECSPNERAVRLTDVVDQVARLIQRAVEERCTMPPPNSAPMAQHRVHCLSFWLANASELLHFLKNDRHLSAYTLDAQDMLAESVRLCFGGLVRCLQADLDAALPPFIRNPTDIADVDDAIADVVNVLAGSMTLLKRCRVNAALTIQLFSQLFHFLNMWLFNATIKSAVHGPALHNMCHRLWGSCLKRRLSRVVTWAEKQGLELAADCHLSRIIQAAHLLQTHKSQENAVELVQTCFKLNSLQLRAMLERYRVDAESGEPPLSTVFVEQVCKMAETREAASPEQDVRLEEDPDLQLPFLLPEDGYTCEVIQGVPPGLTEFLAPLANAGLCRLTLQPTSIGMWTIYMADQDIHMRNPPFAREAQANHEESIYNQLPSHPQPIQPTQQQVPQQRPVPNSLRPMQQPEICTLYLKKLNKSMGLSIIAARGHGQEHLGIYVKSIVPGGAADQDGRLQAGDHLLKVDGHSLSGISQDMAAQLMMRTADVVCLEVAKQGAILHGLANLLQQSPMAQANPNNSRESIRRLSDRDASSRMAMDYPGSAHTLPNISMHQHQQQQQQQQQHAQMGQRMQESRSVPVLSYAQGGQPPGAHGYQPQQPQQQQQLQAQQGYPQPLGHDGTRTASVSSLSNHYEQHPLPSQPVGQQVMGPGPSSMGPPMGPPLGPGRSALVSAPPVVGPKPLPGVHQQPRRSGDYDFGESVYQNISIYQHKPQHQSIHAPQQQYMGPPGHGNTPHSQQQQQQQQQPPPQQQPMSQYGPQGQYGQPKGQQVYPHGMQVPGKPAHPAATMHPSAIYGQYQPPHPGHQIGAPLKPQHGNYAEQMSQGPPYENHLMPIPPSQYTPAQVAQVPGPQHPQQRTPNGLAAPPHYQNHIPPNPRVQSPSRQVTKTSQWQETSIMDTVRQAGQQDSSLRHASSEGSVRHSSTSQNPNHLRADAKMDEIREEVNRRQLREKMQQERHETLSSSSCSSSSIRASHDHQSAPRKVEIKDRYEGIGQPMPLAPNGILGKTAREEKERRERERLEEVLTGIDMEIEELETLPSRDDKQEDRLRCLRLEREFRRRADEGDDDDDEEDSTRRTDVERIAQIQDNIEKARQQHLQKMQLEQQQQQQQQQAEREKQQRERELQLQQQLQQQRDKEIKEREAQQKQLEDAAASLETVTLVDSEDEPPPLPKSPPPPLDGPVLLNNNSSSSNNNNNNQDTSTATTANTPTTTITPAAPASTTNSHGSAQLQSVLKNSNGVPSSPSKGNLKQPNLNNNHSTSNNNNNNNNDDGEAPVKPPAKKKVSFHETHTEVSYDNYEDDYYDEDEDDEQMIENEDFNSQMALQMEQMEHMQHLQQQQMALQVESQQQQQQQQQQQPQQQQQQTPPPPPPPPHPPSGQQAMQAESLNGKVAGGEDEGAEKYTLEDIDEVLNQPQLTFSPQAPGVIGSQEVYRDPRQRIINAKQSQKASSPLGPEKLTFQEKMKMFAKDGGERTPKAKTSLSKAQREIDTHSTAPTSQ